jgi:hypothetical protein
MDDDDELVGLMSAQPVALDGGSDDDDDLGWLQTAPSQTQLRSPRARDEDDAEAAHLERLAQEGEDDEAALAEAEGAAAHGGAAKTTRESLDAFASRARPERAASAPALDMRLLVLFGL